LEKYRYEQSLEHTSQFIEKLEKELEDYQKHVALFKKRDGSTSEKIINDNIAVDDHEIISDMK
jgi:flagellar biosynthesis chaperone FliJ